LTVSAALVCFILRASTLPATEPPFKATENALALVHRTVIWLLAVTAAFRTPRAGNAMSVALIVQFFCTVDRTTSGIVMRWEGAASGQFDRPESRPKSTSSVPVVV